MKIIQTKKEKDETVKRANRKKKEGKKKEGKKKGAEGVDQKIKKLLIEIGLLEEEETEKQVYESYHGSRECLQDTRKLSKSAVVYPEEVIKNGGTTRISANGMPEQHDRESQGNVVVSGS